jgi:hypothetical protein
MLSLLLSVLLTQLACVPGDTTTICYCKQGVMSACEVVRQTEPEVFRAIEAARAVLKVEEEARDTLKEQNAYSCDSEEGEECKGQWHHIISKRIFEALERHQTLRGKYKARDSRFVSRAKNEQSHCGYQSWHRDVDREVAAWLKQHEKVTTQQFESYLREVYKQADLAKRFPHGF